MRGTGNEAEPTGSGKAISLAVLVAALGYFVDIFDLLLFAILRIPSLTDIGVPADQAKAVGIRLDNVTQTTGLMVGGLFWGVLGDRKGRLSVLFGSILCYSLANLLNAFIADVDPHGSFRWLAAIGLGSALDQYALLRFVAGFGLAGELGAGITLVAELMGKEHRGVGTTIVASVGVLGAVAAALVGELLTWRTAYLVGGGMGLALLVLRIGVVESGMFEMLKDETSIARGTFWKLFHPWSRLRRYLAVVVMALPIWFVVGILVKYSPEIAESLGLPKSEWPTPGRAILFCYMGLAAGDLTSGLLSQLVRSRRRAVLVFHALTFLGVVAYFAIVPRPLWVSYVLLFFLGFGTGYWAVFATMAAEQFGTNLRATAATTAPNFVRWAGAAGSALAWNALEPVMGRWQAAACVGAVLLVLAVVAVLSLRETFGMSLSYVEE